MPAAVNAPEDPRITTARVVLADVERARASTDPDEKLWTPEAIADRHGRLAHALRRLLDYIDEVDR